MFYQMNKFLLSGITVGMNESLVLMMIMCLN